MPPLLHVEATNHHVLQAGRDSRTDIAFSRTLSREAREAAYHRRTHEKKSVVHWGQRKLLLAEIEFLTTFAAASGTVVYAGAAPGVHIAWLATLFPGLRFLLYDSAPFCPALQQAAAQPDSNVTLRGLFTDRTAASFRDAGVYFISDIRRGSYLEFDDVTVEQFVAADMAAQMRWHLEMRPAKSMLKFRLPWPEFAGSACSEYLDGDVYLPVWGPQTTTEARLVPYGAQTVQWDNARYERQMFYFNTVTRVARYEHAMRVGAPNHLDYCYDCAAEAAILQAYVRKTTGLSGAPLARAADALCAACSAACTTGRRTLRDVPRCRDRAAFDAATGRTATCAGQSPA